MGNNTSKLEQLRQEIKKEYGPFVPVLFGQRLTPGQFGYFDDNGHFVSLGTVACEYNSPANTEPRGYDWFTMSSKVIVNVTPAVGEVVLPDGTNVQAALSFNYSNIKGWALHMSGAKILSITSDLADAVAAVERACNRLSHVGEVCLVTSVVDTYGLLKYAEDRGCSFTLSGEAGVNIPAGGGTIDTEFSYQSRGAWGMGSMSGHRQRIQPLISVRRLQVSGHQSKRRRVRVSPRTVTDNGTMWKRIALAKAPLSNAHL